MPILSARPARVVAKGIPSAAFVSTPMKPSRPAARRLTKKRKGPISQASLFGGGGISDLSAAAGTRVEQGNRELYLKRRTKSDFPAALSWPMRNLVQQIKKEHEHQRLGLVSAIYAVWRGQTRAQKRTVCAEPSRCLSLRKIRSWKPILEAHPLRQSGRPLQAQLTSRSRIIRGAGLEWRRLD